MKLTLLLCMIILMGGGCFHSNENRNESIITSEKKRESLDLNSTKLFTGDSTLNIELITIDQEKLKDTEVEGLIIANFGNILGSDVIDKVLLDQTKIIHKYGNTSFYKVQFKDDAPNILGKSCYFFISKERREAGLLWLAELNFFKLNNNSEAWLIAGLQRVKGKGYFLIYSYDDTGWFNCTFSSGNEKFCNDGVPIYNSTLGCQSYDPFILDFKNIDLNNDGILDLAFKGNLLTFCEGLERGIGRNDKPPKSKVSIEIEFITMNLDNGLYWNLQEENICNMLIVD